MRHWNFVVERCERTGKGRGRVPLHDDPPGGEDPGDARQCSPRQIGQVLIRPHNFEIPIRPKAEQVENSHSRFRKIPREELMRRVVIDVTGTRISLTPGRDEASLCLWDAPGSDQAGAGGQGAFSATGF